MEKEKTPKGGMGPFKNKLCSNIILSPLNPRGKRNTIKNRKSEKMQWSFYVVAKINKNSNQKMRNH